MREVPLGLCPAFGLLLVKETLPDRYKNGGSLSLLLLHFAKGAGGGGQKIFRLLEKNILMCFDCR